MNRSPYQSRKKNSTVIAPVGSYETGGVVYMLKLGAITPDENPIDFQEASQRQGMTTMIFLQAVKNCAKVENITQAEARTRIFPGDPEPTADLRDFLEIGQISKLNSLHYEAVRNAETLLDVDEVAAKERVFQTARVSGEAVEASDLDAFLNAAQVEALDSLQSVALQNCIDRLKLSNTEAHRRFYEKPTADLAVDLYDYLEPEQAAKLVGMQDNARKIKLEAATLFLRYRLAYPIVITEDANPRAGVLKIEPLRYPVAIGNLFRVGDIMVEADDVGNFDEEELRIKPLSRRVLKDEVGFLMDVLTGMERLGSPDWSQKDTKRFLTEDQVAGIYDFYMSESGQTREEDATKAIAPSEDENLTLTQKSDESPSTLAATLSIGAASSGSSNVPESTMTDSPATTLGLNLIG